jgi:hypothetical protein
MKTYEYLLDSEKSKFYFSWSQFFETKNVSSNLRCSVTWNWNKIGKFPHLECMELYPKTKRHRSEWISVAKQICSISRQLKTDEISFRYLAQNDSALSNSAQRSTTVPWQKILFWSFGLGEGPQVATSDSHNFSQGISSQELFFGLQSGHYFSRGALTKTKFLAILSQGGPQSGHFKWPPISSELLDKNKFLTIWPQRESPQSGNYFSRKFPDKKVIFWSSCLATLGRVPKVATSNGHQFPVNSWKGSQVTWYQGN